MLRPCTLIIFLLLAEFCIAQRNLGYTSANECRHTAILSKVDKQNSYTARCFIKTKFFEFPKFNFKESIDKEWRWVLNHKGAISGQVIVQDGNSVYMVSQKSCLDRGNSLGKPMRRILKNLSGDAKCENFGKVSYCNRKSAGAADLEFMKDNGDTYADCVNNDRPWNEYSQVTYKWGRLYTDELSPNIAQFLVVHGGGHHSGHINLQPHNFSYSSDRLERVFEDKIRAIESSRDNTKNRESKTHYHNQNSSDPVVLGEFPFETGMSVLANRNKISVGTPLKHCLFRDNSFIAWNRALQARFALSGKNDIDTWRYYPFDWIEGALITMGVIITLVFAIKIHNTSLLEGLPYPYFENRTIDSYALYTNESDVRKKKNYFRESWTILYEIGGALTTILIAARTLILSDLWPRTDLKVSQGGVITYGKRHGCLSVNIKSQTAGSEFFISHWYSVQVSNRGSVWSRRIMSIVISLIVLGIYVSAVKLSYKRQRSFHLAVIRFFVFVCQWPVKTLQHILSALLPNHWIFCGSESYLKRVAIDRLQECKSQQHVSGQALEDKEIEYAAQIIAKDSCGTLSYFQALTILSSPSLTGTLDKFHNRSNAFFKAEEVKNLSMVGEVSGVVLRLDREGGRPRDSYETIPLSSGSSIVKKGWKIAPIVDDKHLEKYVLFEPKKVYREETCCLNSPNSSNSQSGYGSTGQSDNRQLD